MNKHTQLYGIFYRDGDIWRGPYEGELLTSSEIVEYYGSFYDYKRILSKYMKRKVKVYRMTWEPIRV